MAFGFYQWPQGQDRQDLLIHHLYLRHLSYQHWIWYPLPGYQNPYLNSRDLMLQQYLSSSWDHSPSKSGLLRFLEDCFRPSWSYPIDWRPCSIASSEAYLDSSIEVSIMTMLDQTRCPIPNQNQASWTSDLGDWVG